MQLFLHLHWAGPFTSPWWHSPCPCSACCDRAATITGWEWCQPSPALCFPIKGSVVAQICWNAEEQMITQAYEDSGQHGQPAVTPVCVGTAGYPGLWPHLRPSSPPAQPTSLGARCQGWGRGRGSPAWGCRQINAVFEHWGAVQVFDIVTQCLSGCLKSQHPLILIFSNTVLSSL